MRDGRVLLRNSPSTPSSVNRSGQRQTQALDMPVSRMMLLVAEPVGCAEHYLRPPNLFLRSVAIPTDDGCLETIAISGGNL